MKKLFFLFTMMVAFASPRFLTDGYGEAGGPTEPKEEETKQDVSDSDVSDLDTLRLEYEDLTGKKANKLWKEDTLSEKIDELKK